MLQNILSHYLLIGTISSPFNLYYRLIYNGSYITLNGLDGGALRRMSGTTAINREGKEDILKGATPEGTTLEGVTLEGAIVQATLEAAAQAVIQVVTQATLSRVGRGCIEEAKIRILIQSQALYINFYKFYLIFPVILMVRLDLKNEAKTNLKYNFKA